MVEKEDNETKRTVTMTCYTSKGSITKRYNVSSELRKSQSKKLTSKSDNKTDTDNRAKK